LKYKFSRRDALKGMAGLPFLGYFANWFYVSQHKSTPQQKVDWSEFGISEFDPDMYFNWQKWFEFGTGPAGNQFTHEFDGLLS
jgi:hypothetical protein